MLALLLAAGSVYASEIEQVSVTRAKNRYTIAMSARLNAAPADAHKAFTDFPRLPRINDAVESATRLAVVTPGALRLATVVRVCVLSFCRRLRQVQDITDFSHDGIYGLEAHVLPNLSDLKFGYARWRMSACGSGTCLQFHTEIEPDFWVPPLIGPWLIERVMRREAIQTAEGIDRFAPEYTRDAR